MPRPQIYGAWVHFLGQCSPHEGCQSRSAARSSHSFFLTGELLSPNQSDVKRNLSQGKKSRIAHSIAPLKEGIRKEKVRSSKNSLRTVAGDRTCCILTSAQKCIHVILASSNCGMSTRGFFAAGKIDPWAEGASRAEN